MIGGSPCTHWSIAQTKNRETEPSGLGWELFLNYKIARDKYQPDYFLYENNKSMSAAIRAQITKELGVEPVLINSALVSAQNRQRLYWVGKRNPDGTYSQVEVEQPEDRGILLRDILESGVCWREKSYTLDANYYKTAGTYNPKKQHSYSRLMAAEPLITDSCGKAFALATSCKNAVPEDTIKRHRHTMIAETVFAGMPLTEREMEYMVRETNDGRNHFDFNYHHDATKEKSSCVTANIHKGVPYNVLVEPIFDPSAGRIVGRRINEQGHRDDYNEAIPHFQYFEVNENPQKTNCLSTVQKDNMIAEPVRIGTIDKPIYEVRGGQITIKDKQYPIKLADGHYIIRKLTVTECKRLQTVPDNYIFPVSDTQSYKMLGNGWTCDVIAHIMSHFDGIATESLDVLSMYDGMSCGHIALDKLGANVTRYYATEIDKYAIKTTQANYPDTIQLGDAYQVRGVDWQLPEVYEDSEGNEC